VTLLYRPSGLNLGWYQHRGCAGAECSKQNTIEGAIEALSVFDCDPFFKGLEFDAVWDGEAKHWLVCHDLPADRATVPSLNSYLAAVAPLLRSGGKAFQLEVKGEAGDWAALKTLLWSHSLTDEHVMVSSFELAALAGIASTQIVESKVSYPLAYFVSRVEDIDKRIQSLVPLTTNAPCRLWLRVHKFGSWSDFQSVEEKAQEYGLLPSIYSGVGRAHAEMLKACHPVNGSAKLVIMCCDDPVAEWDEYPVRSG